MDDEIVDLNFKVSRELRKTFKRVALENDMTGVELFKACFLKFYRKQEKQKGRNE